MGLSPTDPVVYGGFHDGISLVAGRCAARAAAVASGWEDRSVTRDVVVLGSTGSIGTQALDLVRAHPDRFRVVGLTAGGSNPELFEAQVAEFAPACSGLGEEASIEAAAMAADVVLNGITGAVGLRPTLAALAAGTTLALEELQAFCRGKLGGFKLPRQLVLRETLPRLPSGKVLKRVLRAELASEASGD